MPLGGGIAIGAGAVLGGIGSFFGGKSGANAAETAAAYQYQATQDAIKAQQEGAAKGYSVLTAEAERARRFLEKQTALARQELAPFREVGLSALQQASGFTDPNSAQTQAERDAFQRNLAKQLSARGLTASGTEIGGLKDFELGLARERRNIALGLAGVGANTLQQSAALESGLGSGLASIYQNLGQTGGSLFSNLGQNIGNTTLQGANQFNQLQLAATQARTQGLAGLLNSLQTGILGGANLYQGAQNQAFQQGLLNNLFGQGGGGSIINSSGYNLGFGGNYGF